MVRKNYYKAVAVIVGYIIGVGMFSLPFLVVKAGVLGFFFWLAILIPTQHMIHAIYANMIVVTKRYHRLPGYAGKYIGHNGKIIVFISKIVGNYGALLAYTIITGIFLTELLGPIFGGYELIYVTIVFALEAFIVYCGIGVIAKAELFMTGLLVLVVSLITVKGWGNISITNYTLIDWKYILLPYGILLFSLDGNGALPIAAKLVNRNKEEFKSVIRAAYLLSIVVIIVFTLVIVGITGFNTTEDALTGIKQVMGGGVVTFALIFGVLSMITSFVGVAESIRETLWWDFQFNRKLAWALAVFIPYFFYIAGVTNLVRVISFAGAIAGGLSAMMMILMFLHLKKKRKKLVLLDHIPKNYVAYLLILMFICGILYELYYFLN